MRASVPLYASIALIASTALAGDAPYIGTWKLNPARSDFGETTIAFEKAADGAMKMTADGQSFTFKTDGKEYPTPWGDVTTWKVVNDNTWQTTSKSNGKITGTSTLAVQPDGKTLKMDTKLIRPDGQTATRSWSYERVSGSSGLAGKWKTRQVEIASPSTFKIAANGADGLTLTSVEEQGSCAAKLDGKDHPAKGPIWPAGWTCAIKKHGASGLQVVWKKDGRLMYEDVMTVSEDGKVLTDMSNAPAANEKIKAVYERQ